MTHFLRKIKIQVLKAWMFMLFVSLCLFSIHKGQAQEFEDAPDRIIFDFYVAGQVYGSLLVEYTDTWVQILRPDDALDQMPVVKNKEQFRSLLKGRIPLPQGVREAGVGTLSADPNLFSVYLDLDQQQVIEAALETGRVKSPSRSVSLRNKISFSGNRNINEEDMADRTTHTVSHKTTLSKGRWRFNFSGSQSEELPYDYSTYSLEHDVSTRTYSLGMLSSKGTSFVGSTGYLGVSLKSNYEPLSMRDRFRGTHIEFFVPSRSLVNVYRNETELLYSDILDFGMHILDTSRFPEGAYDLRVEIEEDNGTVTEERHFFAKSERLTEFNYPNYLFNLGISRDGKDIGQTPLFQSMVSWRALDELEFELSFYTDTYLHVLESVARGQVGADYTYESALSYTSDGDAAFRTHVYYQPRNPDKKLTWGLNFTHMLSGHEDMLDEDLLDEDETAILKPLLARKRTSLSARMHYNLDNLSLGYNASYNKSENGQYNYSHGPRASYILYNSGSHQLTSNAYLTKNRKSSDVGLLARYRYTPKDSYFNYYSEFKRDRKNSKRNMALINALAFNNQDNYGTGINASVYDLNRSEDESASTRMQDASVDLRSDGFRGRVTYNIQRQTDQPRSENLSYAFDTSMFVSKDPLSKKSKTAVGFSSLSGNAILKLEGSAVDTEMLIKVNGQIRASGFVGDTINLNLSDYKTHTLSIEPASESSLVYYDEKPEEITLYPENLFTKVWRVDKMTLVFGQLVDLTGAPLEWQSIKGLKNFATTDAQGNFQIEVIGSEMLFVDNDEKQCTVALPNIDTKEYFQYIGPIVCG